MSKLRLCPFCGGKAILNVDEEGTKDTEGRWWAFNIVCCKCCATSGLCYTREMAELAWNTRYEPPTPGGAIVPAGNERLKR